MLFIAIGAFVVIFSAFSLRQSNEMSAQETNFFEWLHRHGFPSREYYQDVGRASAVIGLIAGVSSILLGFFRLLT